MEYLEPWEQYLENEDSSEKELYRELCDEHILHGVKAKAIAHRCDCDDVLFELSKFTHGYAVVHLTFSKESNPQYPSTELFQDLESWSKICMVPDHQDYTS